MGQSQEVKVWDVRNWDLSVANVTISGFDETDTIDFELDEDGFTEVKGVDGDIAVCTVVAEAGTLNVHLSQGSKANALFSGIYRANRLSPTVSGLVTLQAKDRTNGSYIVSDTVRIVKPPPIRIQAKVTPRVWKIRVYNPDWFEAGL